MRRAKKLTAWLLTLALILTLLPVSVLAAIPGTDDQDSRFKNMLLHSAVNRRPISTYQYKDSINYFQTPITIQAGTGALPSAPAKLEWTLLTFAIDRNQTGDLKLYKLDTERLEDGQIPLVPRDDDPDALEDFLIPLIPSTIDPVSGEEIEHPIYLSAKRFLDNIDPPGARASDVVQLAQGFDRAELDTWHYEDAPEEIIRNADIFGRSGLPYMPPEEPGDSNVGTLSLAGGNAYETASDTALTNDIVSEASSIYETSPDAGTVIAPVESTTGASEKHEISYYDGVRFTAPEDPYGITALDAGPIPNDIILNFMFWDGSLVDENNRPHPMVWENGAYYVIVFQPDHERTAIFNTFLAFQVVANTDPDSLLLNPDEYNGLYYEWPGDPVNLLTGSFSWNYTDLSLYGRHGLPFTRYYESTAFEQDHHFGNGFTTNYSYELNVDLLYADFFTPHNRHVYFSMMPDGSYRAKAGSAFSLDVTDTSYVIRHRDGTTYIFDRNDNSVSQKIRSISSLDGEQIVYAYNGDLISSVTGDAGTLTFTYTGEHVTRVTDSTGRSITLSYDGELLTAVENPDGDSLRYTYENGLLERIENFRGEVYLTNDYDATGRVTEQFVTGQGTFRFSYDEDAHRNTCTGENGYYLSILYDEQGRIIESTNSEGSKHITYNELNQRVSETDREGNTTRYTYDDSGNCTQIIYPDGTLESYRYNAFNQIIWMRDRNGIETSYAYDTNAQLSSFTDGRGNTTNYIYDTSGNLLSVTDALGAQTSYVYDKQGNCISMTDALGHITAYAYDEQGRLISVTDAAGNETSYEYTTAGKLVKIIGADGNIQAYTVDGNGFTASESDCMGNITTYIRDTQNNVVAATDPLGNTTSYTYDSSGNLATTTDANGSITRYTYDAEGRMVSMTDARGNTWRYTYNKNGQLLSTTDPTGGIRSNSYNSVGRTVSGTDANGNTTTYAYDGVGNLTKITDALGMSTISKYDANGNLISSTDRNGNETTYAYDAENRLIRTVDAEGNTTVYTYDALGRMTATVSAMGSETVSTYDEAGRLLSATDALGHVTGYEYDALGRATKISYADGSSVSYTYDANGQILTAANELGNVISYTYDANGQLISMTDAMGGITVYAYDPVGNVISVTDALGGVVSYLYDEVGNISTVTDANGNATSYAYDVLGRAVAITDPNGGITRAEYDHNGNITKATDAEGNVTVYTYDALDRLTGYTNAEGYTFSFQYDNEGNLIASTDGNGNTTRYIYDGLSRAVSSINAEGNSAYNTYDADGRMIKASNEEGAETFYSYDADGRLISMADALGNVTGFEYDSRDRVIKVTDAKGNATTFTYDLAGNVKSETNARGVVTSYAYDANGNLTSMTDAAGTVAYTYDALNRVTSVKDRRGNTQFFTYDATDRIVHVKDRNGNATRYVYDGNGNIVKTIDALGTESVFTYNKNDQLISTDLHRVDALNGVDSHEITLYEYDGRNLVTKEINALGDSTVYVYDGNGNLVSKTDADGYVTQYSYTALDLVEKINYNGAKEVSYQYNKVGELVQMDDWTGTNTFELDLLGRLQKMTDHKGNTVSYTYDAVGNQTGITYPDGSKTRSFYDAVYNLTSVIDADDGTYAYVYDAANRPVKLTYPNGWIEQYTYDAEGNLLKTVDTDPFQLYNKTPKVKYEYTYDAEGNVLTEFQRDSDATENLKSRTAFTYDALNRLTGSTRRLEVYPYDTLAYTYTYDTLGNLLKQSGPTKGEEDTYQYNDLNQMVSKHVCGYEQKLTRIYDYGYTYDKRGNLVKEEEICSPTTTGPRNITIATYLYDETNRMVQGTNKAGEVSAYTFNGLGVRVGTELILKDNTHGYTDFHCQTPSVETGIEKPEVVKTDYVIDYTRLDIDQRVLMKSEQDGYDFFYTYGLDKLQVMTIGEGSNWWGQSIKKCVNMAYVHTDRLGSVVNLSDQYGRVTARADYTDWGEVRRYTDITVDGGFRRLLPEITYATHEYDDVLNQFYAKARMYDAENKRFDAVDPVKGLVTQPVSLVQYVYVFDNPVSYIDPDGEFGLLAGTIIATAASAVISGATAAYQSYKTDGKVNWKQVGKAAVGGAAAAVSVGIAVATGGTALGVGVMAAGAIAGTRTALHGGNAADIAFSMGKASAGAAVGGKALSAASATVKFVVGVAGTAAGTAATVKTTQTAAKTIRDKNATTQEKAAAVFDAALSAAGTIGSAALVVKSFPAVKQEIGYYMAKYQCKTVGSTGNKLGEVFDLADNYTLTDETFNNHILDRHGPGSTYASKSHFNANFDIKRGIESTLKGDSFMVGPNTGGRSGYIFEQTFDSPIGVSSKGKYLYTLKVVIDEVGNVITAFPKK